MIWARRLAFLVASPLALGFVLLYGTTIHAQGDVNGLGDNKPFSRGDVDGTGDISLPDAIKVLNYLFSSSGNPAYVLHCDDAVDFNDDEEVGLADAVSMLAYMFSSGAPPAAPFGACGLDETDFATLSCEEYPSCDDFQVGDNNFEGHVLRRIAYGPTPQELDHVLEVGAAEYIFEQLYPEDIDESANDILNSQLAALVPDADYFDLYRLQFARGLYSEKQLQEQLANFWDVHFNTYFWTPYYYFATRTDVNMTPIYDYFELLSVTTLNEYKENTAFRDGALGNFYDLLEASATSVSMLIYLDSVSNVAGAPNENYARELLELHTMGVDNGYVYNDIVQIARCFTGWQVCLVDSMDEDDPHAVCQELVVDPTGIWAFHFNPDAHDYGAKTIFDGTTYELNIPARPLGSEEGIQDGYDILNHLIGLSQTAEFISTKLIKKFVNDEPPPALLAECIATWLATDGDIREVVSTILNSPEFEDPANYWNKVKTPLEYALSTVRAFDGETDAANMEIYYLLAELANVPFNFGTPDGFPESGFDQLSTYKILERINFNKLIYVDDPPLPTFDNVVTIMSDHDVSLNDAEDVTQFWLDLLFPGNYTEVDHQLAIDFLSTNDAGSPQVLASYANLYPTRIRKMLTFLASYPQQLKQ